MENSFLKDAINRIVELATPFTLETRDGHQLGVNEPYWAYIMENLQAQGYITGLTVVAAWGGARSISNLERCQITPDGIAYMFENNLLAKAKELLKDVKAMTPFI